MVAYKTPGVYVEEISTLPPSVAEVSTAIPAFLGHTEKAKNTIASVSTMLEYEEIFGGPSTAEIKVTLADGAAPTVEIKASEYLLYHAVSHYLKNGGGVCYIVSVGDYTEDLAAASFEAGLKRLEKEDEPTLVILTDAVGLDEPDFNTVCQASLTHCHDLGDRFAIFDVRNTNNATIDSKTFRDGIGTKYLDYGAAYYPYLQTTLSHAYDEAKVNITDNRSALNGGSGSATPIPLASIRTSQTAVYQQIKKLIGAELLVLPPSAAIAGLYASVDRDRGVWKAPANLSLNAVVGPTTKITNAEQDNLNVDPTGGKSINGIRAFTGKGTLAWGARTLAGNDNEWRYVPVRRLFLMIEESTRKASSFAVFEPNDMSTWLKVRGAIESFLYGLWERGALAGPTPEAAYFVKVGLGTTMTSQDILEGRMIVKIGIAAVRPAEFIVLQFSHKLQEA
jgi:hypothetical protein